MHSEQARINVNEDAEIKTERPELEDLVQDLFSIGRMWARHGLTIGKQALENSARTLEVTAGTLLDGAPNQGEIPDLEIDSTAAAALRCFKKLSAEDKKQLTWIIQRYAQSANP